MHSETSSVRDQSENNSNNDTNNQLVWGKLNLEALKEDSNTVYEKIVYWKQNLFKLPTGSSGKAYVREITRLVTAWNSKSNIMDYAWKCIMIMPALLLQKPAANSKAKDHKEANPQIISLETGELRRTFERE